MSTTVEKQKSETRLAPTPQFTITIDSKKDVLDLEQGKIMAGPASPPAGSGFKGYPITPGTYQLTYNSGITYHGSNLPVKKCIVYNTTDGQPGGWFYMVDDGASPLTIVVDGKGTQANTIWAFIVDITSQDNNGTGTLTVTPI